VARLKAEQIFALMRSYLDRGEGKHLIPKIASTYVFEIITVKGGPVIKAWTIDLKNGQGAIKEGKVIFNENVMFSWKEQMQLSK
jgi:3-hydroxyacyl-CoA dehydrogenase/3a,7a,12a-trihydroxy-5b-cholest-24-enoyl-CoA hydratase